MAGLQLHRPGTALGLILVVVCLAYANSFGNGWHYDDAHTITENPHIRSLADPLGFFTERTWFARDADKAMFRPLVLLSLALNYSISELDTVSYHVVNLLIHIGATMLLWVLLRQMGRGPSLALLGAMLFGLHPLCTEPVNYISSRSESLASLFVMACLVCHLREGPREFGWWRAASATCFAGAMLSKETGITALGLIVLYDLSRGPLQWRYLLPRLRPTHGLYLALALGYLLMQSGHVNEAVIDKPVRDGLTQFMTQVKALGHYARLLLVPRGLSVQHQFFEGGPWLVVGASLLMITSLIFVLRRASSDIVFGLAWCVTVLSPTLVVPLFVLVNDHRLYLPIAGLVIALTGLWMDIRPLKWPPRVVTGVSVAGLLLLGVLTQNRNPVWADEYTLWSDAAAKSPQPLVPVAYVHLGNYAKEHGALPEAIKYYRRALQIAPEHIAARNNLGLVLQEAGRVPEAASTFAALTREHPEIAEGWYNLGNALQLTGVAQIRTEDGESAQGSFLAAQHAYQQVADTSTHHHLALNNLGTTFQRLGRLDSAAVYYRRAIDKSSDTEDALRNLRALATGLEEIGPRMLDERQYVELALLCDQLSPMRDAPPEALFFAAVSRFYLLKYEESLGPNRELIQRYPGFLLGYLQLGNALETLGRVEEAHTVYRQMLSHQSTGSMAEEARRRLGIGVNR